MKKVIIFIIIIGLIGGGYWWYVQKNKSHEQRCQENFRFNPSTKQCEPAEQQKKGEIDFSTLKIKTSSGKEISLQQDSNTTKYSGKIEGKLGASDTEYVSLDSKEMISYSDSLGIVPYLYNSGGTGQFIYIGIFDKNSNIHLDSIVLGDRISVDSIQVAQDKVKVNFKDRLLTQSFAETPTVPTQFVFEIKENKIVPIMQLQNADYADVEIKTPLPGEEITGDSLVVKGAIPGSWYFEANAGFKILDGNYKEIAFGNIQALSDWMTTQKVSFEISVSKQSLNYTGDATIIISSDNPSGMEEKTKKLYLPVKIK
ncbi:MAG: hypothetical protein RLZZ517_279 [Candidatus Parcubacteria bacterium]|jgi:hypothetical protein